MFVKRKIVRSIILIVLLMCTAYIVYSIVKDPLDTSVLVPALATTAGIYMFRKDLRKNKQVQLQAGFVAPFW